MQLDGFRAATQQREMLKKKFASGVVRVQWGYFALGVAVSTIFYFIFICIFSAGLCVSQQRRFCGIGKLTLLLLVLLYGVKMENRLMRCV